MARCSRCSAAAAAAAARSPSRREAAARSRARDAGARGGARERGVVERRSSSCVILFFSVLHSPPSVLLSLCLCVLRDDHNILHSIYTYIRYILYIYHSLRILCVYILYMVGVHTLPSLLSAV